MLSQWLEYCATDTKVVGSSLTHVLNYFLRLHIFKYICLFKGHDCKRFYISIANRRNEVQFLPVSCILNDLTSLMVEQDTSNIWIQVRVLGKNSPDVS